MGDIFISIFKWLVKEARLPRFVWLFIGAGLAFLLVAFGIRIMTAQEFLFGASEKFNIAVRAQERALATQEKAQELYEAARREREQIRTEIDKRFDELIERMERAKSKLKDPAVTIFSPGVKPKERLVNDISAAQMNLSAMREAIRNERFQEWKKKEAEKRDQVQDQWQEQDQEQDDR
jgi:hypothetical protein